MDAGVDHGVTLDLEQEHRPLTDELCRQRHHALNLLGSEDGCAGRDTSQQGDVADSTVGCSRRLLVENHQCPRLGRVLSDGTRFHKRVQV